MTHKILIELDEKTEAELRTIAEHNSMNLSEAARGIITRECGRVAAYLERRKQYIRGRRND